MATRRILTVHGISTDGEWQERVQEVLEPHFECLTYRYRTYRRLGALKLLLEPWVLFPGVAVVAWLWWKGILGGLGLFLGIAGLLGAAHLASYVRRWRALRRFHRFLGDRTRQGERLHVIAHSFGTFLVGQTLQRFPSLTLRRLVLAGCVLPRAYDWRGLRLARPSSYAEVRNEVGRKDWVVALAYTVRRLVKGFGRAGLVGFQDPHGYAHTVDDPWTRCGRCFQEATSVHNIELSKFTHSDHFISVDHARKFWLPFFWEFHPAEYQRWLDQCELASWLESQSRWADLALVEEELRARDWTWWASSLEGYLQRQLTALAAMGRPLPKGTVIDDVLDTAVRLLWQSVAGARRNAGSTGGDQNTVVALNPHVACGRALDATLTRFGEG